MMVIMRRRHNLLFRFCFLDTFFIIFLSFTSFPSPVFGNFFLLYVIIVLYTCFLKYIFI